MLRYVFRVHRWRREDEQEGWVDYIKRSAEKVDSLAAQLRMESWVSTQRRRKWRFAGKLAQKEDQRWSKLILDWKPNLGHGRSQGRPRTRWCDQLADFAGDDWQNVAADSALWRLLEDGFVLHL